MKNSSYYIAPVGDWTHDLPHTVASNMVKVSHALNHSATEAVNVQYSYLIYNVQYSYNKWTKITNKLNKIVLTWPWVRETPTKTAA